MQLREVARQRGLGDRVPVCGEQFGEAGLVRHLVVLEQLRDAGVAAGLVGPGWPLRATVFVLGASNGAFSIAAIGSMMALTSVVASIATHISPR